MNRRRFFIFAAVLFFALLINSCEWTGVPGNSFDYELWGTWESNDKTVYDGKVIIDYNSITITGYSEDQGKYKPASQRPFNGFLKDRPITAYSENGKIYFDLSEIYDPILYSIDTSGPTLYFTFGGRREILIPVEE